jgi:hypothetical protein
MDTWRRICTRYARRLRATKLRYLVVRPGRLGGLLRYATGLGSWSGWAAGFIRNVFVNLSGRSGRVIQLCLDDLTRTPTGAGLG